MGPERRCMERKKNIPKVIGKKEEKSKKVLIKKTKIIKQRKESESLNERD